MNIIGLKDLMKINNPSERKYLNEDNYRHILKIYLGDSSLEYLNTAKNLLEARNDVKYVSAAENLDILDFDTDAGNMLSEINNVTAYSNINDNTYYFNDMNIKEAWEICQGSRNITIGILDKGINYNHEDLADNMWVNTDEIPNDGIDNDNNGYIDDIHGWNFANNSDEIDLPVGHGTISASIARAVGDNSVGMSGVAQKVSIAGLTINGTVENNTKTFMEIEVEAMAYVINNDIDFAYFGIILGPLYNYEFDILQAAIENYDSLCIVPSGNAGDNLEQVFISPICYDSDNILTVGGTSTSGNLIFNYGQNTVDVLAGAEAVCICVPESNNTYDYAYGTSVSAPLVLGVAVLLKNYNPSASWQDIKTAICSTVNESLVQGAEGKIKYPGIVDAYAALMWMKENSPRKFTWDFGDDVYSDMTNLTSNITREDMTFKANAAKPMTIEQGIVKLINGVYYNGRLKLTGEGDLSERSISFDVFGDTNIYITADATTFRNLVIADENGNELDKIEVSNEADVYRYEYKGEPQKIYLYSQDSGIQIYAVSVTENTYTTDTIDKEWNIGSADFAGYSTITSETTVDGLTIVPNATVAANNHYVDNIKYTRYIGLLTAGNAEREAIKFDVPGPCNITIVGRSSGTETRNILVGNKLGYLAGKIPVTNQGSRQTVKYTGCADTLYITSQSGGIRIYDIMVSTVESEPRVTRSPLTAAQASLNTDTVSPVSDVVTTPVSIFAKQADITTSTAALYSANTLTVSSADDSCYSQLSEAEKSVYNSIKTSIVTNGRYDDNLLIVIDTTDYADTQTNRLTIREMIKSALSAFINDHPEIFWIDSFDYAFNINNGVIEGIDVYITKTEENKDAAQTADLIEEMNTLASSLSAQYNAYTGRFGVDYDRIVYLADLLRDEFNLVGYDEDYENQSNAAGALINNCADSFGAARAFKLLCDECGITCLYAEGYVNNIPAAYNLIKYDGNWYVYDITSDDNYMTALPGGYVFANPSVYGDNNVRDFSYPALDIADYIILGDADMSGYVTANDAAVVIAHVMDASSVDLSNRAKLRADVDFNGIITANDSSIISSMALGFTSNRISLMSNDSFLDNDAFMNELLEAYNALAADLGVDTLTMDELKGFFENAE